MSNISVLTPDKVEILYKKAYLKWRNEQIIRIYDQCEKMGIKPYPKLKDLTGLSWQALWKIINYVQE